MKKLIRKLLYKNLSKAQLLGFVLSNFVGLAILTLGIQFWEDARPIWEDSDSFMSKDYLVINKKINGSNTLGDSSAVFTADQIKEIQQQPWSRRVAPFTAADYRIYASLSQNGRGMSTALFFEAIPDEFIDVADNAWSFKEGDTEVPIIISKDYLSLYNFGFAGTAGLEQLSEQTIGAVPMTITIRPDDGSGDVYLQGRIVGFSNRLNTILVPQEFMDWSNARFSSRSAPADPSRLIIDVSSPGDVAITRFMQERDYEVAGDKAASGATFLVNVITSVALVVGALITLLSFFILMLSISLLMQKNRAKIHSLIMQGVDLRVISGVYTRLTAAINLLAWLLAAGSMFLFRSLYLHSVRALGARAADPRLALGIGLALTLLMIALNTLFIRRRVHSSFLNRA